MVKNSVIDFVGAFVVVKYCGLIFWFVSHLVVEGFFLELSSCEICLVNSEMLVRFRVAGGRSWGVGGFKLAVSESYVKIMEYIFSNNDCQIESQTKV